MLQLMLCEPAERGGCFRQVSLDLVQIRLVVELPRVQVLPAVDGAMICVLENPYFTSAFGGVKLCHRPENFQEDALHHVLGFTWIANDFESNTEDKAVVAVEQDGKGVVAASL
jgi:hypothetical protein